MCDVLEPRRGRVLLLATLIGIGTAVGSPAPAPASSRSASAASQACEADVSASGFVDVTRNVHRTAIECAAEAGLVRGTTATTFSPEEGLRRDQLASILLRLLDLYGVPTPPDPPDRFDDDNESVHEAAVNRLAELGILHGSGARSYAPGAAVRREHVASLLVAVHQAVTGTPLPDGEDRFDDDADSVHQRAINQAAEAGIVTGSGGRSFQPGRSIRRDQMASMLSRLLAVLDADGPRPAIYRVVAFGVDDGGTLADSPAIDAASAGRLVTLVGRNLPANPVVTVGDPARQAEAMALDDRRIVVALPVLDRLPALVDIVVSSETGSGTAVARLTIDAGLPTPVSAEDAIRDFVATALSVMDERGGDDTEHLRRDLERLAQLLGDLTENEKQQIAGAVTSTDATAIIRAAAGLSTRQGPRTLLRRGASSVPKSVPELVVEIVKFFVQNANPPPFLDVLHQSMTPREGGTHWVQCYATDPDTIDTVLSPPTMEFSHGDARWVQRKPTSAPPPFSKQEMWTGHWVTPVTGNLRVVGTRCQATDSPLWQNPKTARQDFPVVVRETLSPQIRRFSTRDNTTSQGPGDPNSVFAVGERFEVHVRATDDVIPDHRFGYEPSGIWEVVVGLSDLVRVENPGSFRQGPAASGGELLRFRYRDELGFRGDFPSVADPLLRHTAAKADVHLMAYLSCTKPGYTNLTLSVADRLANPAATAMTPIHCVGETEDEPPPVSDPVSDPPVPTHVLEVVKKGTGDGTVTSQPAGISCGSGCSSQQHPFAAGTIALTGVPGAGSEFVSWGGDCTAVGPGGGTVQLDAPKTCEVEFRRTTITESVLYLGGWRYPVEQFVIAEADEGCDGSHYHSSQPVHPLESDGPVLDDPAPDGCGYGHELEVERSEETVPIEMWDDYRARREDNP